MIFDANGKACNTTLRDDQKHVVKSKIPCCMVHPDNECKIKWDVFIMLLLLFSCIETPIRLAFESLEQKSDPIYTWVVDGLFLLDIIVIFNTMVYDEECQIV